MPSITLLCNMGVSMGMQDRDWYRDLLRERAGLEPKAQSSKLDSSDIRHNPYYVKPDRSWHPVLQFLLFAAICVGAVFILSFFKH